jgi:hypothetical protein
MLWANAARGTITLFVAFVVLARQGALPGPDTVADAATAISTDTMLYALVLAATLLLGIGEVLYDNSAQTFMPSIVHPTTSRRRTVGSGASSRSPTTSPDRRWQHC